MYIDLSTSKLQIQFYSQPELLHCNGTHLAPPQDFLHDRKTKELLFFFPWPSPLPMGSQSDCKDVLKQTAWKLAWGPGLLGQDWIPIKDLTRLNSLETRIGWYHNPHRITDSAFPKTPLPNRRDKRSTIYLGNWVVWTHSSDDFRSFFPFTWSMFSVPLHLLAWHIKFPQMARLAYFTHLISYRFLTNFLKTRKRKITKYIFIL